MMIQKKKTYYSSPQHHPNYHEDHSFQLVSHLLYPEKEKIPIRSSIIEKGS